jgi:hypothetical protein
MNMPTKGAVMASVPQIGLEEVKEVVTLILKKGQEELHNKTQEQLEEYWFFSYNFAASKESNLYEFGKMLDLYRRSCREWEEQRNGSCCVVERVRDTYLMPKIKQFIKDLES